MTNFLTNIFKHHILSFHKSDQDLNYGCGADVQLNSNERNGMYRII